MGREQERIKKTARKESGDGMQQDPEKALRKPFLKFFRNSRSPPSELYRVQ